MKNFNYILFSLISFLAIRKEAHTMDPPENELHTDGTSSPRHLSPAASPMEISRVDDPYNIIMTRQGNTLVWEEKDANERPVKNMISSEEFEKLNTPFAQINSVPFDRSKATQINEVELKKLLDEHSNPNSPNFFSIIDGEGVFFEGTIKDKIIPYFVTGGVHNCVAVTLHGRNGGRIFSALVHIARSNDITSMDTFLKPFLKFKEKQITLRSHYKSETLLNTFNYITGKKLQVNSVYVNDAYHSVNGGQINITFHPTYYRKNDIDGMDSSQPILRRSIPLLMEKMRPCAVILNSKTGKILEIPDSFVPDARRIFQALRPKDFLKAEEIDETNAYTNIKAYHITTK